MYPIVTVALVFCLGISYAQDQGLHDQQMDLCAKYPNLSLCRLQAVLPAAMEDLAALFDMDAVDGSQPAKLKRKSAFVRFGKRKSAFVRFGKRADGDDKQLDDEYEKRKSSYIRFG